MPAKLDIKIRKDELKKTHPDELATQYGCSASYVLKLRARTGVVYVGPRKPGSGNTPKIKVGKLDPAKSLAQNVKLAGKNPATGRYYSRSGIAAALARAAMPKSMSLAIGEPDFL